MTSDKEHVSDTAVLCAYEPPDTLTVWTRPAQFTPDKIPVRTKGSEHRVSHTAENILQFIAAGRRKIIFFFQQSDSEHMNHTQGQAFDAGELCVCNGTLCSVVIFTKGFY